MNGKIISKYKNIPVMVKASFWFAVCSVVQKGIAFITIPIFTRVLTTEEYGLFTVFQSWNEIILIFATLNLCGGAFNNGMLKYEKAKYISSMQGLSTIFTVALFGVYIIFHDFINKYSGLNTNLFIVMFVGFLFSPALSFWSAKQRFQYKYIALVIITIMIAILTPLAGIIAIKLTPYKAEARIYTSVLVSAVVGLILYVYQFCRGKKFYVKEYWLFALTFNLPLVPHYVSKIILAHADRIMIGRMCGVDKAGIYGFAYSISTMMSFITSSINQTFVPWTYKTMEDKRYKEIGTISNYIVILVFAMILAVILFAPEVIKIVTPVEYHEAIWVVPPVAMSAFFTFIYTLFGNIEFYFERTKYIMIASIIGAILNIVLNYIFINMFGYIAAGYTTLVCYMAFCFAHYVFMKKCISDAISGTKIYNMRFIVFSSILLIIISLAAMCLYNHIIIRYIILLITAIAACIKRKAIIEILVKIKNKE